MSCFLKMPCNSVTDTYVLPSEIWLLFSIGEETFASSSGTETESAPKLAELQRHNTVESTDQPFCLPLLA